MSEPRTDRRQFMAGAVSLTAISVTTVIAAQSSVRAIPATDPVFNVVAKHLAAWEGTVAAEAASQIALLPFLSEDDFNDLCSDEMDRFIELLEVVPTTLSGVALVAHLNLIYEREPWKFEDNYATPLIGMLAKAFSRMEIT